MAEVQLAELTKVYDGADEAAVDGLDLEIDDGEFVVFVGPSGCGKSTALRMIAGLEQITGGEVRIGDRVVNMIPPKDRDIAMVFQNYALYPHMTVSRNLDYPLRIAGVEKEELNERVDQIARTLQLTELLGRKPAQLSGGQRQRVAMGRALIRRPAVFLMDEPLSNLDAKLRVSMRSEIARIQSELSVTTVYVTHDQVEAMTMGDRVVVLNGGELQQVAPPEVLYNKPANVFVAGFIGSPAMNLWTSKFEATGNGGRVSLGIQDLRVPDEVVEATGLAAHAGKELIVGIRPDDLFDDVEGAPDGCIDARVTIREALGSEVICHLDVGVSRVLIDDPDLEEMAAEGMAPDVDFVGRFAPTSTASPQESRRVRFDVSKLHFFDAESGQRIDREV
ncbi:MAG: ABC transporter ATP-binding protein [Acidimicrobiales bacterium]